MKYSEATKLIQGLSKKYSIKFGSYSDDFEINYKNNSIAWVDMPEQFRFGKVTSASEFDKLPYSHKLWMILTELAMTPISEREEHKWKVIVGNDSSTFASFVCWKKSDSEFPYILCFSDPFFYLMIVFLPMKSLVI